jgi:hypothetical protein
MKKSHGTLLGLWLVVVPMVATAQSLSAPTATPPKVTAKELVAGPMLLNGKHTFEKGLFTFIGNSAEPERAIMSYDQHVYINSVGMTPTARLSYHKALVQLGIPHWIGEGGTVRLQFAGPVQVLGTDNHPILSFPVVLQETRGSVRRSLPYTLQDTYSMVKLPGGMSPSPTITHIAMLPR